MPRIRSRLLTLATTLVVCGCADTSGPEPPPLIAGSWVATAAVDPSGSDIVATGFDVGMLFIPSFDPAFVLVSTPPAGTFAEPQIVLGFVRTANPDDVFFFDLNGNVVSVGTFQYVNQILTLELDGGLGYTRLVLAGSPGPLIDDLDGRFTATRLILEDAAGGSIDLLAAGGTAQLGVSALVQAYTFDLQAPAGTLGPDPFTLENRSGIETVGRSIVLVDGLGCSFFGGLTTLVDGAVTVRGYACDLGGTPYLIDMRLER